LGRIRKERKMDQLSELAYKYGSDRCPQYRHPYTPFYYELLKDKIDSVKKVVEVGIGRSDRSSLDETAYDKNLGRYYHTGAGLFMWHDFFPNAQIYGIDSDKKCMFEHDRIKTFLCDERNVEGMKKVMEEIGSDVDLFVDDGNHHLEPQLLLAKTVLPLLKKDVIYIIEDVFYPRRIPKVLSDYECEVPPLVGGGLREDNIVIVKNK